MNGRRWLTGGATMLVALAVLLWGLLPPHVMETGQLDPRDWMVPMLAGLILLAGMMRWTLGMWRWPVLLCGTLAIMVPPIILCVAGSAGQKGRAAAWLHPMPSQVMRASERPRVGLMSGPVIHAPRTLSSGFERAPLWHILSTGFELRPVDALDKAGLKPIRILLLIQPRALAPEELVALDDWVRMGGRAILLTDPDLRWADERTLGHPLRAPSRTFLEPLLQHWGLKLAPVPPRTGGDPVERRLLDGGQMLQIAGASHFLPDNRDCTTSSAGLVARCRIGRGTAVLVADADFANDALWTTNPAMPRDPYRWTSDAPAIMADFLAPGAGEAMGRRVWLARADGLSVALRPALAVLLLLSAVVLILSVRGGTKSEKERISQNE